MMTSHNWRRAVEGQTISHHLKSGAIWMIFIGVTETSFFLARDVLPWKRHTVRSQISCKAVEAWTGDIKVKIGGRWDCAHWIYSNTVFNGEGCVAMETAYDDIPELA